MADKTHRNRGPAPEPEGPRPQAPAPKKEQPDAGPEPMSEAAPPRPAPTGRLQDGLELWASETRPATVLSLVRLDGNESLLLLFTSSVARVTLHYLASAAYRG